MSKELELQLQEALRRIERLEAAQACRNLMGKYSYYHTAFRNKEYIDLWAKRDDDLLVMPWGSYQGFEGVKACYMKDHGDRSDPKVLDSLKGAVMMHEMDTEVIEVAEDGKSAKALWQFQAADTRVTACGPLSIWKIGYMAADLVEEDGEFKVLNLLYALDIDHPCAEPWTEPSKYAPDPEFAAFDIPEPQPTVPMEVYRAYSVDRPYQELPKMPVPYTTLAETFSYGI